MEPCIFEPGGLLRDGEYMVEVGCNKGKVLKRAMESKVAMVLLIDLLLESEDLGLFKVRFVDGRNRVKGLINVCWGRGS